jgi:cob(I)alamin adenosyltransferase
LHNISFYLQLMSDARAALEQGRFVAFRAERLAAFAAGEAAAKALTTSTSAKAAKMPKPSTTSD